jgi:two-component sensor histidine kinase
MASLPELARIHTDLDVARVEYLQRLVANWGVLADLSFADLLLWAPVEGADDRFVVLGHIRPTTSQTIYRSDWTGLVVDAHDRPLVARCLRLGTLVDGEIDRQAHRERIRVLGIPVRLDGETIAVLSRESASALSRHPGELETTYMAVFDRFARMIVAGRFPYPKEDHRLELMPRVGDGVMVLDESGRLAFTSPNAVSALLRLGVDTQTEGMRLVDLGLDESISRRCFSLGRPVMDEVERGPDITVLLRCLPLIADGRVTAAVCMTRDISELRARDRLLLSKDATIREIHHRVKNNLQTISSLLRLQGRRLRSAEAKDAVEESVRRIRSIALVHETLSREAGEDVPFIEIVRPLVRMVEEGYSSPDRPLHFEVRGEAGKLPAWLATPLAVVLAELLQNVVDHAYPAGEDIVPGGADVELGTDGSRLEVRVTDDGVGPPDDFDLGATTGLGLQIVRALVETDLSGTIEMTAGSGPRDRPGTVVNLWVPLQGPTASIVPDARRDRVRTHPEPVA